MTTLRTLLLLPLLTATLTSAVANDPTEFIRFKEGDNGNAALQIAKATYVSKKTGVKVVLYGVVHIADKAYYQAVQKDLDSYDAVLYEAVKPPKDAPKPKEGEEGGMTALQRGMAEMLGLQFQKEGINYQAKNLIHADMTYDQLLKASGGDMSKVMPGGMLDPEQMKQMGPMLKMGIQFMKQMTANNPAMRDRLKRQFASQMVGQMDKAITGEMHRVIVVERNKVAMQVLERELAKRKDGTLGLFYGAAHNKDFHERLVKLGFEQKDKTWMDAWAIGKGISPNQGASKPEPKKAAPKLDPKKTYY